MATEKLSDMLFDLSTLDEDTRNITTGKQKPIPASQPEQPMTFEQLKKDFETAYNELLQLLQQKKPSGLQQLNRNYSRLQAVKKKKADLIAELEQLNGIKGLLHHKAKKDIQAELKDLETRLNAVNETELEQQIEKAQKQGGGAFLETKMVQANYEAIIKNYERRGLTAKKRDLQLQQLIADMKNKIRLLSDDSSN